MSEAILDVTKKKADKPKVKRLELEYVDMNYIIINFEESVIDVNGELWEYAKNDEIRSSIEKLIWEYEDLDEFDYWPDKMRDHAPISPMWRMAWYDEFDTYYHKSGAIKYPDTFMVLVNILKGLR